MRNCARARVRRMYVCILVRFQNCVTSLEPVYRLFFLLSRFVLSSVGFQDRVERALARVSYNVCCTSRCSDISGALEPIAIWTYEFRAQCHLLRHCVSISIVNWTVSLSRVSELFVKIDFSDTSQTHRASADSFSSGV